MRRSASCGDLPPRNSTLAIQKHIFAILYLRIGARVHTRLLGYRLLPLAGAKSGLPGWALQRAVSLPPSVRPLLTVRCTMGFVRRLRVVKKKALALQHTSCSCVRTHGVRRGLLCSWEPRDLDFAGDSAASIILDYTCT